MRGYGNDSALEGLLGDYLLEDHLGTTSGLGHFLWTTWMSLGLSEAAMLSTVPLTWGLLRDCLGTALGLYQEYFGTSCGLLGGVCD